MVAGWLMVCLAPRRPRRCNRTILSEIPRPDQIGPRAVTAPGYAPLRVVLGRFEGEASILSDHPPPGWVPPDPGGPPPGAQSTPPGAPGGGPGPYGHPYGSAAPP